MNQQTYSRRTGSLCDVAALCRLIATRHLPVAAALLMAVAPLQAAVIVVTGNAVDNINDNENCSIVEAIRAANTNSPVDACPAGDDTNEGGDIIELGSEQFSFEEPYVDMPTRTDVLSASFALPPITSIVTISGGNSTLSRAPTASHFAFFNVQGQLNLANVTLTGGQGAGSQPGAIDTAAGSSLMIDNSTIADNKGGTAGGIRSRGGVTIHSSTFSGNTAGLNHPSFAGGAIYATGTLDITNSTISGNTVVPSSASLVNAGGLFVQSTTATVTNSTITENGGVNGFGATGYGVAGNLATATLVNSIIAHNEGGNCYGTVVVGTQANLSSDATCQSFTITETDPKLGPLADNGGPTRTHAPAGDSPAIDGATGSCPFSDQRGTSRDDASCDLGAVEVELVADPGTRSFKTVELGTASKVRPVTFANRSGEARYVHSATVLTQEPRGKAFEQRGVVPDGETPEFAVVADNCSGHIVNPGDSCEVDLQFTPDHPGPSSGTLQIGHSEMAGDRLSSDAPQDKGIALLDVPLKGKGVTAEVRMDSSLSFGTVKVDRQSTKEVTIKNSGSADLNITSIDAPSYDFSTANGNCVGVPVKPGGKCTFTVTFWPSDLGEISDTVTVQSNAHGGDATLAVSGIGR